jgi:hypothetical protein
MCLPRNNRTEKRVQDRKCGLKAMSAKKFIMFVGTPGGWQTYLGKRPHPNGRFFTVEKKKKVNFDICDPNSWRLGC